MAESLPLYAYSTLASQVEAVKREGFAFFPGILSAETVAALRSCMDQRQPLAENYDWDGTPTSCGFLNKAINSAFTRRGAGADAVYSGEPPLWPRPQSGDRVAGDSGAKRYL